MLQHTIIVLALVVVSFGALFARFWWQERIKAQQHQAIDAAHDVYRRSLITLMAQPTNADSKQRALALGRQYAKLTRESTGFMVYDEMALMHDITAALASASAVAAPQSSTADDRVLLQLEISRRIAQDWQVVAHTETTAQLKKTKQLSAPGLVFLVIAPALSGCLWVPLYGVALIGLVVVVASYLAAQDEMVFVDVARLRAGSHLEIQLPSAEDRLKRLDELRAKGIINDQEYAARRQKILEDL
jgi:hypothetical protein